MTRDHIPLTDRIRTALAAEPSTREVSMFGGLSFMVNEKIAVAVQRDGDLLARVDPDRNHELLALPGAEPAEMGAGRVMGPGWIRVAEEALTADRDLSFWIGAALAYNTQLGTDSR